MDVQPVRRALLSVSDKRGLVAFARRLVELGVELVATGGTARTLAQAGLAVREVGELTGVPELLEGRVKSLHPAVHAALLARRDRPEQLAELASRGIAPIDLLVVQLYPFEQAAGAGAGWDACIEQIDVGGPAMIRAAAKNHAFVAVVVDPDDYDRVLQAIAAKGGTDLALRRSLAAKAFARTARYDAAIARWMEAESGEPWPDWLVVAAPRISSLRYGENPHQRAALYRLPEQEGGVANARQLQGRELSYNNLLDADSALRLVWEFDRPAAVILKHHNPCGAAERDEPVDAWRAALACDPVSAYGGIAAFNRPVDAALAEALAERFLEVVVAPDFSAEARSRLAERSALRLLAAEPPAWDRLAAPELRSVTGGLLVQDPDRARLDPERLRPVTRRRPDAEEMRDLLFAWTVCKHVRSNAIVLAREGQTVGIGAGQMSRVDAVRLAIDKARRGLGARASVLASDAFFPFADGIEEAARAGVRAVIQPGGSRRDPEVIRAAEEAGIAMLFTGVRHFRH